MVFNLQFKATVARGYNSVARGYGSVDLNAPIPSNRGIVV